MHAACPYARPCRRAHTLRSCRCSSPPNKRNNTAEAVDKAVMEITLLGLVSLILTTFASPLSRICGGYGSTAAAGCCGWPRRGAWQSIRAVARALTPCPCCCCCSDVPALDGHVDTRVQHRRLPLLPGRHPGHFALRCAEPAGWLDPSGWAWQHGQGGRACFARLTLAAPLLSAGPLVYEQARWPRAACGTSPIGTRFATATSRARKVRRESCELCWSGALLE